jgi:hypothetical protein
MPLLHDKGVLQLDGRHSSRGHRTATRHLIHDNKSKHPHNKKGLYSHPAIRLSALPFCPFVESFINNKEAILVLVHSSLCFSIDPKCCPQYQG